MIKKVAFLKKSSVFFSNRFAMCFFKGAKYGKIYTKNGPKPEGREKIKCKNI